MQEEFLKYYHQELAFLRESGKNFAKKHPEIAAQLGLGSYSNQDPAVAQLLQSMALISTKLQQQLDDTHRPLTHQLLDSLHPHLFRPFPSCAIVQFQLSQHTNQIKILAKHSPIHLQHNKGHCQFQTAYATPLWPVNVSSVTFKHIQNKRNPILSIALENTATRFASSTGSPHRLRFYIHADPHYAYAIYELILLRRLQVMINNQTSAEIQPVGLHQTEHITPSKCSAVNPYQLFLEFFAFPEKFLFFDVVFSQLPSTTETLAIDITLDPQHHYASLENYLNASHFRVNCAPVMNLFTHTAEPLCKNAIQTDYHLIVDHQRPPAEIEVYAIRHVMTYLTNCATIEHMPLLRQHYSPEPSQLATHWQAIRKPCWQLLNDNSDGSEIILRFIEHPQSRTEGMTRIETICTNRNLPYQLSLESDVLTFEYQQQALDEIESISCLVAPTPTRYLDLERHATRLNTLLNNHPLSYYSQNQNLERLQTLLRIHQYAPQCSHVSIIESILSLQISTQTLDIIAEQEIQLTVDTKLALPGLWALFGTLLHQYFRNCAAINSFTTFSLLQKNGEFFYPCE